jgi:hypothetical protein
MFPGGFVLAFPVGIGGTLEIVDRAGFLKESRLLAGSARALAADNWCDTDPEAKGMCIPQAPKLLCVQPPKWWPNYDSCFEFDRT